MQKIIIPKEEAEFKTVADPFGKVFHWNNRVFRAIPKPSKDYCLELINSKMFSELVENNLIPKTWVSEYDMEGFEIILEHEKARISSPSAWSFEMFKDAAITYVKVNDICKKHGYKLKDGHPWNILINKNQAIFVDIGSIVPESHPSSCFYIELDEIFINILLLWSQKETFIARKLFDIGIFKMQTLPQNHITDSTIIKNLRDDFLLKVYNEEAHKKASLWQKIKCLRKRKKLKFMRKYYNDNFCSVDFINKYFNYDYDQYSMWSDYQSGSLSTIRKNNFARFTRFKKITDIINSITEPCDTLIDLAGNQGAFSLYVSKYCTQIKSIINTDYDETAINQSYLDLKEHNENIESFLLNFIQPIATWAFRRFKSDIAVALAVTHHLLLTQGYDIEYIFNKVKAYSNKYVVIEFMPLGLWDGTQAPPTPDWYNLEWFRENFEKHFELMHEEQLEENRIVFAGRIKA